MNVDDLDRQVRFCDGVPPDTVDHLLQQGRLGAVVDAARAGEWFCARGAVREFVGRGEFEAAWEVIAPYADTGWWPAVEESALLLDASGRGEEAMALVRTAAERGERSAWNTLARLMAGNGRVDEAIEVLRPRLGDSFHLEVLVEVCEGRDRDGQVIALLRALLAAGRGAWNTAIVLAGVLERGGRVDEAVAVLRTRIGEAGHACTSEVRELVAILARNDRPAELRLLAAGPYAAWAVGPLAWRLAESGRLDEGVALLRSAVAAGVPRAGSALVFLLAHNGLLDEAGQAVRPELGYGDCEPVLCEFLGLLVDAGRAREALELATETAERNPDVAWYVQELRPWLLSEAGLGDQAMAEVSARVQGGHGGSVEQLAVLLEAEGRVDEAIAALWERAATTGHVRPRLARMLIGQGRVDEAIALHRLPTPVPASDEPLF